jgi:hypothetical protein
LTDFSAFLASVVGLPVSHVWRGYGSALFVELGELTPSRVRRDGSPGNPEGEMSLMIEWSWRIERPRSILCGSFSDETKWPGAFAKLVGTTVENVTIFGRLPEVSLALSNGLHVSSFMTAEGQPQWVLFDRRAPTTSWLAVERGAVTYGMEERPRRNLSPQPE